MPVEKAWSQRYEFWKSMSARSHALFLLGVFFMFMPAGLLTDLSSLGANGPVRLTASAFFAGGIAVAYVLAVRYRVWWLAAVIAVHLLIDSQFDQVFGPIGSPLAGEPLQLRVAADVNIATTAIVFSFVLLSELIRSEGTRLGRLHTEMRLARDIHRLLVPPIARRIGRFEFRGISAASGEVGGDLIDVIETSEGWTGFVADVSGHGVGAGLLMGMAKSAARTKLATGGRLDELANTLNTVLFDLKSPAMFATFAGLQHDGNGRLRFLVAGHLPVLHYQAGTGALDELTLPQIPLAIFDDWTFTCADVGYSAGDLFVILTDGLTEVFDGRDEEFGLDRVKAIVVEHAAAPLEAIERALLAAVNAHGRQLDDQTLLLVRASDRPSTER
jgi:serine phosphatase RsbU (regulator of sigma subunit)